MAPYAPPFKVACRICYQIEGKLKNYKNDAVYIKAYECLTGYQFEEVPYLNKFCPSCALSLKKLFRFRKACQSSHYWLMDYMNTGRKVSQPYIRQMQEYKAKNRPVELEVWKQNNQKVVDCVHATKRYKPKPKVVYDIGVSHLSVPKNPEEESWHIRRPPKDYWSDDLYPESDLDEEESSERAEGETVRDSLTVTYFGGLQGDAKTRDQATMTEPPDEDTDSENSEMSFGSNPAETFNKMKEFYRNKTSEEIAEILASPNSKRKAEDKENEPTPSTSNINQHKRQKNEKVELTKSMREEKPPSTEISTQVQEKRNLYFCLSCRLGYEEKSSLDMHVKMHHGPSHKTTLPQHVLNTSHTNTTLKYQK